MCGDPILGHPWGHPCNVGSGRPDSNAQLAFVEFVVPWYPGSAWQGPRCARLGKSLAWSSIVDAI